MSWDIWLSPNEGPCDTEIRQKVVSKILIMKGHTVVVGWVVLWTNRTVDCLAYHSELNFEVNM